jgi:plastocyanin
MKIRLSIITPMAALIALAAVAFTFGCAGRAAGQNGSAAHSGADSAAHSAPAFKAEFAARPPAVKAGEPATLTFTVRGRQGALVRDLQVVHEKPMHLLIISGDLAEFSHVHPQPQPDGTFKVTHTFASGGDYRLYADFTPANSSQVVEQVALKVGGGERARQPLVADAAMNKTVDGLSVTLAPDKPLKAGDELMLNFKVADARTGRPATNLQKYLGEYAHFVIVSEDLKEFLHAHPMSKEEHAGGAGHGGRPAAKPHSHKPGARPHSHGAAKSKAAASPSEVAAHTTFPKAGRYKVWAQFQRAGRVITVPFVVDVAAGESAAATGYGAHGAAEGRKSEAPADAIKVTVSKDGYAPGRIEVKQGQPVKLAFTRADSENCGGTVVFPALNIKQKLPVGETVVVEVTPKEAGELNFACGMGMMKGALVVQ